VAAEPLLPAVEPTLQGFRLEPRQRPGGGPAG
jgi:hypothetical protein